MVFDEVLKNLKNVFTEQPATASIESMGIGSPVGKYQQWDTQGHVPYRDTRPNATKSYSTDVPVKLVKKLAYGALERGINPAQPVAQAIGETTAAKWDDPSNPLNLGKWATKGGMYHKEVSSPITPTDKVQASLNYIWHLKNNRYKNDPEKALQGFQGRGILRHGVDNWNGRTQNAGKTLPYVKKVRSIEKTFTDNPELQSLIKDVTKNFYNKKPSGSTGEF